MARVFFSYAFEDEEAVGAVYAAVAAAYPQHEPWMDKYEIVAGNSLLAKIAEGMDQAQKFFVFLSVRSVAKPWVQQELRRAIMREIESVDSDYIVPVKMGNLERVPPFLEDKRYINLQRLRRDAWLVEFDAAIAGAPTRRATPEPTDNVEVKGDYPLDVGSYSWENPSHVEGGSQQPEALVCVGVVVLVDGVHAGLSRRRDVP